MKTHEFVKKRKYLFWDTVNYNNLSEQVILEAVLNYGSWEDVQIFIKIIGIKKASKIFNKQIKQKRSNYRPQVKNYFKLYFNKYA